MKLKKIFVSMIALLLTLNIATINVKASTSESTRKGPHPDQWNVLVLILPIASIEVTPNNRQNTSIQPQEITKITEVAQDLETLWSTNNVHVNVDVKTDYAPINEKVSGVNFYNSVTQDVVKNQIAKNSKYNEYDSIMIVYRELDGTNNLKTNDYWSMRTDASKGASYSVYRLADSDHSLSEFDNPNATNKMAAILLESVRQDLYLNGVGLTSPYNIYRSGATPGEVRSQLMNFMHSSDKNCMGDKWGEFLANK